MKILITGGAGYVGYALCDYLLRQSSSIEEVVVYDSLFRRNYAFFSSGKFSAAAKLRFIQGDLLDSHKLGQALKGIQTVVHLAAKVTTPFADTEAHAFEQVNHWGTANLAQALEQNSAVKHVINLSSVSVYGSSKEPLDETHEPGPGSFYGISKLRGERQLEATAADRQLHTIRSGNVYGFNPAMRFDAVINRFLFDAHFKGRLTIDGSGEQMRSFIHVDKLASVLGRLILQPSIAAGTYNLVEHNFSVNTLAEKVAELYPGTEQLSVNQHMPLREVQIKTPCKILEAYPLEERSLEAELRDFGANFSF